MKLSRIDRQRIKDALKDGLTQEELASLFGVSQSTISKIARNKLEQDDQIADRMERFLGGVTLDDGCYNVLENKTPSAYVDNNDPLSVLLAEERIKEKIEDSKS